MAIRKRRVLLAGLAVAALSVPLLRPSVEPQKSDPYFEALQQALIARGLQRPVAVLDLDRVDGNLAQIRSVLGPDAQYRATTKSLPSYQLLQHVLSAMGSNRVMEFHAPYLRPLIESWNPSDVTGKPGPTGLDILLGKPLPKAEVDAFYANPPPADKLAATRLRWLVDHEARLADYLAIAQSRGLTLDIVIELDVGLHRGGVPNHDALRRMMDTIVAHPAQLRFAGIMGYEGHVPYAPPLGRSTAGAQAKAFADAQQALAAGVDFLRRHYPAQAGADLLVNSGGSKTFPRFRKDGRWASPANELAIGSAVVKPSDFDTDLLAALQPALFIAEPVLKRSSPGPLPHAEGIGALWAWWDRNRRDTVFVYGGGWDVKPVYPKGLHGNPLYNTRPADNRIPNQTLLNVASSHPIRPGDFVFYRPLQGDIIVQFEEVQLIRSGQVIGTLRPFARRL